MTLPPLNPCLDSTHEIWLLLKRKTWPKIPRSGYKSVGKPIRWWNKTIKKVCSAETRIAGSDSEEEGGKKNDSVSCIAPSALPARRIAGKTGVLSSVTMVCFLATLSSSGLIGVFHADYIHHHMSCLWSQRPKDVPPDIDVSVVFISVVVVAAIHAAYYTNLKRKEKRWWPRCNEPNTSVLWRYVNHLHNIFIFFILDDSSRHVLHCLP